MKGTLQDKKGLDAAASKQLVGPVSRPAWRTRLGNLVGEKPVQGSGRAPAKSNLKPLISWPGRVRERLELSWLRPNPAAGLVDHDESNRTQMLAFNLDECVGGISSSDFGPCVSAGNLVSSFGYGQFSPSGVRVTTAGAVTAPSDLSSG